MTTMLVTGGAGFIGSNYVRGLLNGRADVRVINLDLLTYAGTLENLRAVEKHPGHIFVRGDICDQALVASLFRQYPITAVINFCAESHVDRSIADSDRFARTNVMGVLSLLNGAKAAWQDGGEWRAGVKFLQISTDEVYGALGAEGAFTEDSPLSPSSPYSASKAAADLMVLAFGETYGMPVNLTRCSNNLGPSQHPEKLIPLIISNALRHKEIPVYGTGRNIRDWIFVSDHLEAIRLVLEGGRPGRVYNVGGGNERTNLEVVRAVLDCVRAQTGGAYGQVAVRHVEDRKGHDFRYAVDTARIRRELGWRPRVSFDAAVNQTVSWYLNNRQWLEKILGTR